MDKERRKKIQTTKLIITEIFMLVIVVLTVVILTFIVMGYRLNKEGKLEQSGLVQVESVPTGAAVIIDGEVLPNETNTSKILPEGSHTIELRKEGYTSWTKTVDLHSGFLTKLSYPHLYKENPKTEIVQNFEQKPSLFLASKKRDLGLIKYPDNKLEVLDLESKTPSKNQLDLLKIAKDPSLEDLSIVDWSNSGERIILTAKKEDSSKFFLVDLEHPEYSLDLSAEFDIKISELRFLNDQGDRLGIIESSNFRTVSLSDKKLSEVLIKNVLFFSNYDSKIALVTKGPDEDKHIILYDTANKTKVLLAKSTAEDIRAYTSEYAGRPTLVLINDNSVSVYRGDLPTEDITKDNPLSNPVGKFTIEFNTPRNFDFKGKNQLIVLSNGNNFAVFDLENYKLSTYTLESNLTFWADEYTIGAVSGGKLILHDFDGTNAVTFKDTESDFSAIITKDNNYLYYITKNDSELSLVRDFIK